MRRTVAESLPLLRSQRKDGADEVEEQTVDQSQQVTNDRCAECQMLPVFTYDVDADDVLAECRASCGFAQDVVAEPEQKEEPGRLSADVDPGVRVAVAGLGVAAARQQADDDSCREEDDDCVEENGDEAERDARVIHRTRLLPGSTLARACRVCERRSVAHFQPRLHSRGNLARLPGRHPGLTYQQVREIGVVPTLHGCSDRPSLGVEAVRRDRSALLIDENLDSADRGPERLLHAEPMAAGFLMVVTVGTSLPGPKPPLGNA